MKLDKKQRVMLVLTIIAIAFLAWQVIDLIGGDVSSSSSAAKPVATTTAATTANVPEPTKASITDAKSSNNASPVRQQVASQRKEYLQMADQFELAKMQSELLKQELDIAQTKQKISETNQKISGAVSGVGGSAAGAQPGAGGSLRLVYLGQINDRWSATVADNGQYATVTTGSVLPNGSVASVVNKDGVTYRLGGKTMLLGFNGPIVASDGSPMSSVHQLAARVATSTNAAASRLRAMKPNDGDGSSLKNTLTGLGAKTSAKQSAADLAKQQQQRVSHLKTLNQADVSSLHPNSKK